MSKLVLKKVPSELFPEGLYVDNESKPEKKTFAQSLAYVEKYKAQVYQSLKYTKKPIEKISKEQIPKETLDPITLLKKLKHLIYQKFFLHSV